jgi:hypothetical protein
VITLRASKTFRRFFSIADWMLMSFRFVCVNRSFS